MKSKYSMIFTVVLSLVVGFSGYALADWSMASAGFNDDPDAIPVFKHWEQKMGKKQLTVCMKADTSQPAVQERCGDQLGELCWSIKSKKDGLTCKALANLFKIQAYAALMERAMFRGDRRAYNYYEDKYTSAMAVNIHLDQLHEQSEGSRLNEKKEMDAQNKANEHFERGSRNKEAGKYKDAIADFSNYIKLYPNEAAAYYNRGGCYMELSNPEKALLDYSRAIEINPQDPDFFSMRGSAHQDLKKFKEAVADYTKAIELGDHDTAIYYNRAYCYFMVRNYQATISDLTKVIELDPDDPDNYLKRARAYEYLSLEQKARDDYKKAAELGSKEAQTRLSAMK